MQVVSCGFLLHDLILGKLLVTSFSLKHAITMQKSYLTWLNNPVPHIFDWRNLMWNFSILCLKAELIQLRMSKIILFCLGFFFLAYFFKTHSKHATFLWDSLILCLKVARWNCQLRISKYTSSISPLLFSSLFLHAIHMQNSYFRLHWKILFTISLKN